MKQLYLPEGMLSGTPENEDYLATLQGLERAMAGGITVEGMVTVCDSDLRLHVDLHCAHGILEPEEAVFCRAGEARKDIAIITRVGKPIAVRILSIERRGDEWIARLSRRRAQECCVRNYLSALSPGDLIPAKVTHLENFGAFLDVGCGVSSLLSVDCISVSRISHPRDRLSCGMSLTVAVKSIDRENGRIYVTLRELLGTWEENAALFEAGQTVTGIIRSVENYGVFVELTPNLAGLAELRAEDTVNDIRAVIGKGAAVYIKSIVPDRMKVKLVLIDVGIPEPPRKPLSYYVDAGATPHLCNWIYSPAGSRKLVETQFDTPL